TGPRDYLRYSFALELKKEANVVFRIQPKIVHLESELGDAFDTHTESIAGELFGVDAAVFQDVWMHHSSTGDFHPAAAFANRTAFTPTDQAPHINFRARFREREERWAQ